mgnify:CR=1 FL=1
MADFAGGAVGWVELSAAFEEFGEFAFECGELAATLSDWLSGFTGEVLELKPDLDQVPALSAERDAQWSRVTSAGFLSDAEKRAILGLPPLGDGADG